ncbi:MAG: S8 family serine peptidase, partial [Dermatophilaceae bacterium]
MRRSRTLAATGALVMATTALGAATTTAGATPAGADSTATTAASAASASTGTATYAVLGDEGADVQALAERLRRSGAKVTSVNTAIGMVTVTSSDAGFLAETRGLSGVRQAAKDSLVGRSPDARVKRDQVLGENRSATASRASATASAGTRAEGKRPSGDPLDAKLWGMDMIDAAEAHRVERGDRRVRVGVMDTGIDGSHPDLAANFDRRLSRNFTTDLADIDGPCEYRTCQDPADVDHDGHGTHVAGTMAAALNGMGLSGVAPSVDVVNVRAGQDSGYFFLTPTVNALTYSGDAGLDVVNMSFYVDPWAYNCEGGAPEDSPEQAAEQDLTIEAMT